MGTTNDFSWSFRKLGGLEQVDLKTGEDIRHLKELKPELWVALSCPSKGLELNQRFLDLLDSDHDGHIRIPEILDGIDWLCARLKDPAVLIKAADSLPLAFIDEQKETGRRLLSTAKAVLRGAGKEDAEALNESDVRGALEQVSGQDLNGDGILPPLPSFDAPLRQFIQDALSVMGGLHDAGGKAGINKEIAAAFIDSLTQWHAWMDSLNAADHPLGPETARAWKIITELKDKFDDYFMRCELAAYAPQAMDSLNVDEKQIVPDANGFLDQKSLAGLPLSRIEPDQPLNLCSGLNPAWRSKVEQLAGLLKPLLSQTEALTRENWLEIQDKFASYAQALDKRPLLQTLQSTTITEPATSSIDDLGAQRVQQILDSNIAAEFDSLAEKDLNMPASAADLSALEQLVLYYANLYRLLINFASFAEFYSARHRAVFQAGTLYLDGRGCRLTLYAEDAAKHSTLATLSQLYLVYCDCTRTAKDSPDEPHGTVRIVAAVTAGDSDLLLESRNAVFVDNRGYDWEATVTKIINKPISLWQAIWSPYKRFGRMITDQLAKLTSSKDTALMSSVSSKLEQSTTSATAPAAAGKFDIAKSAGIFAAVGLALGAIGTAIASLAKTFFDLQWWQIPLVILGLFLIISLPSLILAWIKIRGRTLGPLLEASGWAVNGRIRINYTMSRHLTGTAVLPGSYSLDFKDPLRRPKRHYTAILLIAILLGAVAAGVWLWWGSEAGSGGKEHAASETTKQTAKGSASTANHTASTPPDHNATGTTPKSPAKTDTAKSD